MAVDYSDAEKNSMIFLEEVVKNYKIFIDTCSLLSDYAEDFWDHLIPLLLREHTNVVVPLRVYEEVESFASGKKKADNNPTEEVLVREKAIKAKERILRMQSQGLIRVLGEDSDSFADNVFQTVFTQFRIKYNLILITQDKNLAEDILRIGESKSVSTNTKILVRKINKYGYLSFTVNTKEKRNVSYSQQVKVVNSKKKRDDEESLEIAEDEIFAHVEEIISVKGEIKVNYIPGDGDTLYAERGENKKEIKLIKQLGSGGEGNIFSTDIPNLVAKIYKPGKLDKSKFEKLKLMMTKKIECEGVCFPVALLSNSSNEFVGYLMEKAKGRELQKCLFIPQLLKKYFPEWKKKDTVQLCLTILHKFKYLHDRNVILGDINPNNILVVSPTEVYFVDTDSYQVEGFPCPVGTINFTAPEIQRKKFDSFLRTLGNEEFAVATLLFMIMLPGKPPYSLQGGENQIDNIINGEFAYASGERTNGKAPEGVWRYIWSHMPRYLKDDFYETLHKGGNQSTELTRFSDYDWIKKFEHYADLLKDENGRFLQNDEMSAELFPIRLKKDANTNYVKCKLCKRDIDEERLEEGICRDCLKSGEKYRCSRCGGEIIYTNYQKYIRHSKKYDICKECNDKLNSVFKRYNCANPRCRNVVEITYRMKETYESKGKKLPVVCKDCRDATYVANRCSSCGRTFSITFGDKEYFDNKGFELPKRCPVCRGVKAPVNNIYTTTNTYYNTSKSVSNSYNDSKKKGLCFITTAVCEFYEKPDDCYELTTLRRFRDQWLVSQEDGKELIQRYYAIAPQIVEMIDKSNDREMIYKKIYEEYIEPCLRLVELSLFVPCKKLYIEMVNTLSNKYIT